MRGKIAWILLEALVVSLCLSGLVTLIYSLFDRSMQSGRVVLLLLLTCVGWLAWRIIALRDK